MELIRHIKHSKYNLLLETIPIALIFIILKLVTFKYGFEFIPKELVFIFPSILTGIIFILGFLLAGVVTDYKESEKIPNEIAASLYIIWQETVSILKKTDSEEPKMFMNKLKQFVPLIKNEFFIKKNKKILEILNSFSEDFVSLEKYSQPAYIARLKNEQSNLKKYFSRISIIINTNFAPSVYTTIRLIAIIFLLSTLFLSVQPWWGGLLISGFFSFIIFSILNLIKDLEDPFEYDEKYHGSDEISLAILDELNDEISNSKI